LNTDDLARLAGMQACSGGDYTPSCSIGTIFIGVGFLLFGQQPVEPIGIGSMILLMTIFGDIYIFGVR